VTDETGLDAALLHHAGGEGPARKAELYIRTHHMFYMTPAAQILLHIPAGLEICFTTNLAVKDLNQHTDSQNPKWKFPTDLGNLNRAILKVTFGILQRKAEGSSYPEEAIDEEQWVTMVNSEVAKQMECWSATDSEQAVAKVDTNEDNYAYRCAEVCYTMSSGGKAKGVQGEGQREVPAASSQSGEKEQVPLQPSSPSTISAVAGTAMDSDGASNSFSIMAMWGLLVWCSRRARAVFGTLGKALGLRVH